MTIITGPAECSISLIAMYSQKGQIPYGVSMKKELTYRFWHGKITSGQIDEQFPLQRTNKLHRQSDEAISFRSIVWLIDKTNSRFLTWEKRKRGEFFSLNLYVMYKGAS